MPKGKSRKSPFLTVEEIDYLIRKQHPVLTEEQIRRRLTIMKPYTNWIRTFSCTEGNELIPKIAKEMGMKTLVGAWLGDEYDKNEN